MTAGFSCQHIFSDKLHINDKCLGILLQLSCLDCVTSSWEQGSLASGAASQAQCRAWLRVDLQQQQLLVVMGTPLHCQSGGLP